MFRFSGRRNRKSFFLFVLMQAVLLIAVGQALGGLAASDNEAAIGLSGFVLLVALVALSVASLAVAAQRCRDFGWTGWAILITLAPLVGLIFGFAIYFIPGDEGANRYGPSPLV